MRYLVWIHCCERPTAKLQLMHFTR